MAPFQTSLQSSRLDLEQAMCALEKGLMSRGPALPLMPSGSLSSIAVPESLLIAQ